jgi:hypothetical protein
MSPITPSGEKKIYVPDNLYTALLAAAFFVVLAAAGLVTFLCYTQYGTLFTIITQP